MKHFFYLLTIVTVSLNCFEKQITTDDVDLTIPDEAIIEKVELSPFEWCLHGLSEARREYLKGNIFANIPCDSSEDQIKVREVLRKFYEVKLFNMPILDIDSMIVYNHIDSIKFLDDVSIDYSCFYGYYDGILRKKFGVDFYKDVQKLVDSIYTENKEVWGVDIDGNAYPAQPLKRLKMTKLEFQQLAKEYFSSTTQFKELSVRCDARLVINKKGNIIDLQLTRKVNKEINQLVKKFVKTTDDLWLPYVSSETQKLVNYVIEISFSFKDGVGLSAVELN